MNSKLITAIAVVSGMTMAAVPARAQHGGGHGGGGHGGGGGRAAAPVHADGRRVGAAVGNAVPRSGPVPRVGAPLHATGGRYYPSLHGNIGFGLSSGYPYYGYVYPYGYGYPFAHPYAYGAYGYGYSGYGYSGYGYSPATAAYGDMRIQGAPRDAQVYVDGYYAGIVDDFDGAFQRLTLEAGPHHIEILVPGVPPIEFDVNVQPGRTITYRADGRPIRP